MSFSPTDSRLYGALFSDPELTEIFSDRSFVGYLLEVEAALARVQERQGVIPAGAGEAIASAAAVLEVDFELLREGTALAGFPIVELVRQLRAGVGGDAADSVHWGVTTQDVMDTALVLQLRAALGRIEPLMGRLIDDLASLADRHRKLLMPGRTHGQQALPVTFGLKVAGWLAPLLRHRRRLVELKPRLLVVQFGGAAGTLAALGDAGVGVAEGLADELELMLLPLPWHAQRDGLAELAGWLSLVSGSLAKMAQDVILLAQTEVGELRESADPLRGGSSTMPQKRNPVASEVILAAARANASLLASMHQALIQEHERGTHGWQLEWLSLPQMVALTAAALTRALNLSEQLVVDEDRMRANVAASKGLMLGEAVAFALAAHMDRSEAKALVAEACRLALEQGRHLLEVVREHTDVPVDWASVRDETAYLGAADEFVTRVLREAGDG